jgi:hypothetical protein
VFEAIRAAAPSRLYIAADGPRPGRHGEAERCAEVRKIVSAVDWPCTVRTHFREQNLGCKQAVSTAINWFFENEEEGIILEDDVLPDKSFFPFCDELLMRYRNHHQVMMISGANPASGYGRPEADYFFTIFPQVWGWATWRRAWALYDVTMKDWPEWKKNLSKMGYGFPFRLYWWLQFSSTYAGRIDTWDYQWFFTIWKNEGVCAMASSNLTENLGFGVDATHTFIIPEYVKHSVISTLSFPLKHPPSIHRDLYLEKLTVEKVYDLSVTRQIRKRFKRVLQKLWNSDG